MPHPEALSAREAAPRLAYRADIDGMRAVAVTLVLLFHFSLLTRINAGFLGVDIFFVISGFLITSILAAGAQEDSFRLSTFYIGRIRRLAPALFAVLTLTMLVGAAWLFPRELVDLSEQALAAQFYVANIYFWRSVNYFDWGAQVVLLHTWSLAVEEQFYLLYPAFALMLLRRSGRYFWAWVAGALLMSFGLDIAFAAAKPEAVFYLLPTRAWELLAGAMVIPLAAKWDRGKRMDQCIALAGVILIAVAVTCYRATFHIPGFYALLPTLGSGCLLLSGQRGATKISRVLGSPPLVHIGKISYSLYLVHWPVYALASRMIDMHSMKWALAMLALSFALAELVYRAVENPVHLGRALRSPKHLLAGYGAALGAMSLAGAVSIASHGLPQRFPADVARLADYETDRTAPLGECQSLRPPGLRADASCGVGAAGKTPTWLIYGDSHAWAAHALIDKWLSRQRQSGILLFRHDCPPVSGVHFEDAADGCYAFNESVMHFIANDPGLENIVLLSRWDWPSDGRLPEGFSQTLRQLRGLGRRVFVWEPVPGARASVPLALARAAWHHSAADIEWDAGSYRENNRRFFSALERNRAWIAGTFSTAQALCASGKCIVEKDGVPLYFDSTHMTASTADFWAQIVHQTEY